MMTTMAAPTLLLLLLTATAASATSTPFLSEINCFSFNFCPKGWAMCDGQLMSIQQNQALFALLGTTYGGDGRVNFALPDMRGRFANHMGNGFTLGQQSGATTATLTNANLPHHVHAVDVNSVLEIDASTPGTTLPAPSALAANLVTSGKTPYTVGLTGATTGGNQAFPVMAPYLSLTCCIALQGIFPSQN